jgi:hypothetical protein
MKSLILSVVIALVECKISATAPSIEPACLNTHPVIKRKIEAMDLEVTRLESRDSGRLQTADDVVAKLANMHAVDQYVREVHLPSGEDYEKDAIDCFRDAINRRFVDVSLRYTVVLKGLIAEFGWMQISTFGEEADHHAYMLAQHSDLDRAFQREVLALLEPLALQGETDPANFAYLYDRLAMADDKPQRYGTQVNCTLDGGVEPVALEDPVAVDRLRASVGLPELELSIVSLEIACRERFGN